MDYEDLIGVPFEYGGRGPDKFDCYGLIMELYRRSGVALPDFKSPTVQAEIATLMACNNYLWERLEEPEPGAVILFRIGRFYSHVGMYLGGDSFIHAYQDSGGVTIDRLSDWHFRIEGFYCYAAD